MRIGLIDVDGHNFPNLALMKVSAWHKQQGDSVEWYMPFGERYDRVYMSKVFSFTPDFDECVNADEVVRGGTGYCIETIDGIEVFHREKDVPLPDYIEHIYPDYSLYPTMTKDTAYGFLTRGCPRGCDFCIVGQKEGMKSLLASPLTEFWHGQKNIVLCDPNILASRYADSLLEELAETRCWVDFNQGIDIRLMTEKRAEIISRIKIKEIHFAWDRYEDMDFILPKLRLFAEMTCLSASSHKAIVYTLVNHGTTLEQDLDRIYTLRDMGYWPYVMVYDKPNADRDIRRLQRWVNNRTIFGVVDRFENYKD